ncbi:transposase [Corynebacterium marambiense]|uniref:transposase n=1 Tax=Corynebacterium marambiense TaxID=2765364 RepID=UPI00361E5F66
MTTSLAGLGASWKGVVGPKRYPKEFRDDVVRVAVARDPGVTLVQVATDFGIHVGILDTWLHQERQGAGEQEGVCRSESQELRDLRRRNRPLEQENEVLRRAAAYLSQVNLPGKGTSRS